ncbi:MAG: GGDEF domain-containing protein [Bacilli bacterium]|nr:GGDEF domain-containing protein [Bacilli bacterium]
MSRKTKRIFIIIISVLLVVLAGVVGLNLLKDKNALSVEEKKYLDSNSSKVFDCIVPNDIAVFGESGKGVFFDYIEFLKSNLDININNHNTKYDSAIDSYGFYITKTYSDTDSLFYKDHFVVVSSLTGLVDNFTPEGKTVGVYKPDLDIVSAYYSVPEIALKQYDSYSQITTDLGNGTINYAIVSLNEYKPELIEHGINIVAHVSDLNKYYYFHYGDNKTLNSIYTKMANKFIKDGFDKSYNTNNYNLFINKLGITDADEDTLTNKVYKYGFVENLPYEILKGGEYGGITGQYLQLFQEFSGAEFTYQKYQNFNKLNDAVANKKIDLFYNYYTNETGFIDSGALSLINYYVYADNSIDLSMSNIQGLQYKEVYVQEDSYIYEYIKDIEGIKIKTFSTTSDLKKILRKKSILVIDKNTVTYYLTQLTNDYSVRFSGTVPDKYYSFKYSNTNDTLYRLFNAYTKTIDINDLVRKGITTYNKVYKGGSVLETIAIVILTIIAVISLVYFLYKKNKKRLKINTKVKKEDRIKYIDMLTSLKNRNYLNEQMPLWNKNKIYPQTCIVFDINKVKELNDSSGYEAGDKLIQEVANILVKNQIDNSEIMRTDGNEFMVYMVGYSEKQVMSYLKKITKSLSKLNYEPGVAVGYSTVEDSTKLVEDAFNEASIKMRKNKEIEGERDAKKD